MSGFDPFDDPLEGEPDGSSVDGLIALLEAQRSLLVSVATGGPAIDSVQDEYRLRRERIRSGLKRFGLEDPFPWRRLWDWYGFYSSNLGSYAERRTYLSEKLDPVLAELENRLDGDVVDWGTQGHNWPELDARLEGLKSELANAATLDDLQDVGRRAREIIIDAADLVFDESMVPKGQLVPKVGDAKRRIDHYLNSHLSGSARSELRKLMRSAWDLAQKVCHSDSIARIDAYAAAQAAVLLVRTFAEVEKEHGVRDAQHISPDEPSDPPPWDDDVPF